MASTAKAPMLAVKEAEVGMVTPTFEQIALRVYEIWRREGEVRGKDQDHWLQAVAELTSGTLTMAMATRKKRTKPPFLVKDVEDPSRFKADKAPVPSSSGASQSQEMYQEHFQITTALRRTRCGKSRQ